MLTISTSPVGGMVNGRQKDAVRGPVMPWIVPRRKWSPWTIHGRCIWSPSAITGPPYCTCISHKSMTVSQKAYT